MRFLIHAKIPTEDANKMVQDPNFLRKLENYINKVNAARYKISDVEINGRFRYINFGSPESKIVANQKYNGR